MSINMSFYNGTLNREVLRDFIENTDMPILYTHGLSYRGPTTHNVPIKKSEAIKIVESESLLDADVRGGNLHLNTYSGNDMF